jgi:plasmid stabilization system protein ParE
MELRYKSGALDEFESYLRWYEKLFVDLYSDTGIKDELKIIQEHKDRAVHLKVEIVRAVHQALSPDPVIGRKKKGASYELGFHVGRLLVIACYRDDRKRDIHWIETILIGRRRDEEIL